MDIDLLSVSQYRGSQPHHQFRWLRENAPVYYHDEPNGPGFWVVTRHDDVRLVTRNHQTFSSHPTTLLDDPDPGGANFFGDHVMMLTADPPVHTRMRRLVSDRFKPSAVRGIRPKISEFADRIIDPLVGRGHCDLVTEIAGEMPSMVIADMLGIPLDDGRRLYHHTEAIHSSEEVVSRGERFEAVTEMYTYAQATLARKKAEPTDDLASMLAQASIDGRPLDEMDFFLWFLLLVDAGGDTTRNLVGAGMHALLNNPDQLEWLLGDLDARLPTAIEELLRYVSPVIYMRRTAVTDTELAGRTISAGDKVVVYYGSANRDAAVFHDPDQLSLQRDPNPHIAFGGPGPHHCLGAHLARLEIEELLRATLTRLDRISITGRTTWMNSNFVFGPTSMPIRFTST